MHAGTKLKDEKNLATIPYKLFSVLTLTNRRVIGKSYFPIGPKRFVGEIPLDKIINVTYFPEESFFATPSLKIKYEKGQEIIQVTIRFPGFTAKLAGYNPESVYKLILSQIQ